LVADSPAVRFSITSGGQPNAGIVVEAAQPEPPVAFAIQELQRYVKDMSGAALPIVRAPSGKPGIVLVSGPLERDKQPVEDPREEDHYRLNVDAKEVRIEGASPRAVLFGVYDVLERLGCGWCVPGDDSVPKHDTLSIAPLQVDTRPAFSYRMMLDYPMLSVAQTVAISDWIVRDCASQAAPATASRAASLVVEERAACIPPASRDNAKIFRVWAWVSRIDSQVVGVSLHLST
jgi:hypothetical protein